MILELTIPFRYKKKEVLVFGLSLFAYLLFFLNLYKPFVLQELNPWQLFFYTLKLGVLTMLISLITYTTAIHRFKLHLCQWTFGKELVWILFHFLIISTAIYGVTTQYESLSQITWLQCFGGTALVGIIPLSIDVLIRMISSLRKDDSPIPTTEGFTTDFLSDLVYVRSEGNYLEIYTLKDEEVQRELLREPLKSYISRNSGHAFQVHRSYVINPQYVIDVQGNSNGGKIQLQHGIEVPFSRSYYKSVKQLKQQLGLS
ncbi:MAG: LytTR family transcriptional regulator [Bacteroidia bacterium]|nr:LytTR family transcriptional regulator [Bacteroidia bacterium]